jgi:glucan 1,3-beta-glucosidase
MRPIEYLRHPGSLLAAVAVAIAVVWYALGYPVAMPAPPLAAGEKLDCVSYAPVPAGHAAAAAVSAIQIEADLRRLAPHVSCIRTYGATAGLDRVPEIAQRLGLTVLQGLAIGADEGANRAELERAAALARAHRATIRAFVVGSEVLTRGELSSIDLGALIRRVRETTKMPVTYADRWEAWFATGELANHVNFVTLHVPLYDASYPRSASQAVAAMRDARSKVAARIGKKEMMIGEIGWPSAGRMREGARPSAAGQARVLHEVTAAARADGFRLNIFEGLDQPWRQRDGSAAAHWGLVDAETGTIKFAWGRAVSNHPRWFMQAALGVMLALVVFAAGFLAARSLGPKAPAAVDWRPVALIALGAGLFIGWAFEEAPQQSRSIIDWARATALIALAVATPSVAAATVVRSLPFKSFGALLARPEWRASHLLGRVISLLFVLVVVAAIQIALVLVFDPAGRPFPFAVLTGPAVALLVVAWLNAEPIRRDGVAELAAAAILVASAAILVLTETFQNWEALWLAAIFLVLAFACWLARGGRS